MISAENSYKSLVRAMSYVDEMDLWLEIRDRGFGQSLLKQAATRLLSYAQQEKGHQMMKKYTGVLDNSGIALGQFVFWNGLVEQVDTQNIVPECVQIWTHNVQGSERIFVYAPKTLDVDGLWDEADAEMGLFMIKEGRAGDLLRRLFSVGATVETKVPERFSGHVLLNGKPKPVAPPPAPPKPRPVEAAVVKIEKVGSLLKIDFPWMSYQVFGDVLAALPSHRSSGTTHYLSARYAFAVETLVRHMPHEAYTEFLKDAIRTSRLMEQVVDWDQAAPEMPQYPMLRNYQRYGVEMLSGASYMLLDDMGLGKTIQSILAAVEKSAKKVLIVCPPGLTLNWVREVEKWTGEHAFPMQSRTPIPAAVLNNVGRRFFVCPMSILSAWQNELLGLDADFIIIDEAQSFLSRRTSQTKAMLALTDKCHQSHGHEARVIPMTGTPVKNLIMDLHPLLQMVDPVAWRSQADFKRRFVTEARSHVRWPQFGLPDFDNPERALAAYTIRRLKKEVGDFPEKESQQVILQGSDADMAYYRLLEDQAREQIMQDMMDGKYTRGAHLVLLGKLRQAAERIKVHSVNGSEAPAIEFIQGLNDQNEQVVSFAWFSDSVAELMKRVENPVRISGKEDVRKKQEAVDAFQEGHYKNVVAQIKAGGVGVTLTAARYVVAVGLPWTAADLNQMGDRVHRIGQNRDVTVFAMVAAGTIDEPVWKIIMRKQRISDRVVDGMSIEETDARYERSMFSLLIEELVGEDFFREHGGEYANETRDEASDANESPDNSGGL